MCVGNRVAGIILAFCKAIHGVQVIRISVLHNRRLADVVFAVARSNS